MFRNLRATAIALTSTSFMAVGCNLQPVADRQAIPSNNRPGLEGRYRNLVDTCWPERYSSMAREPVLSAFEQQVNNAQILDQTVWNYHFESGTAKLNAHGREKLDLIARRRPNPDGKLYIQTARDLAYDDRNPDKLPADRMRIDIDRAQAVLAYMSTQPAARTVTFEVQPIDAVDPAMNSQGPATAVRGLPSQYQSAITGAASGTSTGAGGGNAQGGGSGTGTASGTGSGGSGTGGSTGGAVVPR